MSISCRGSKLVEFEGKGVKRKNDQVVDVHVTSGICDRLEDEAGGRANDNKHLNDPRLATSGKRDGDSSRSEKRKKMNDGVSNCARRASVEGQRKDSSFKAGKVKCRFRGDQHDVEKKRNVQVFHEEFKKNRKTWEPRKGDVDVLVSPGRNRWSMTQQGMGRDDAIKSSSVHTKYNCDAERTVFSSEKLHVPVLRNDEEVKRSRNFSKRSRDENVRGLVEAKKKKSEQDRDRRRELELKSQAKEINHIREDQAATGIEKRNNKCQLKTFQSEVCAELVEEWRRPDQALNEEQGRDRDNGTRHVRNGSQAENGHKVDTNEDVPVKHKERGIAHFHHGPESFDGSSYGKDRMGRAIRVYRTSPAPHVRHERLRDGTRRGYDGTQRRLLRGSLRTGSRADRGVESDKRYVRDFRETNDKFTKRRPQYRVQELHGVRKQSHRYAHYPDRGFVKEMFELSSRAVRTSAGSDMIDLTDADHENASLITDVWEVKRRFSSKIVVPKSESEEPDSRDVSILDGNHVVRECEQGEKKNFKVLADGGQGDQSQSVIQLDKPIKREVLTTKEDERQRVEDVEPNQGTGTADPHHESEIIKLHYENSKVVAKTKRASAEGSKERQTSRKMRDTKDKYELQGKVDNRGGLEVKAGALGKKSEDLKCTRPEGMISRKSPEIHLSKALKGGKERTVKYKESLLRRQAIKVDRARDDGGQDVSSHEPKHHKHRGRSHSVSPKLRNLSPEKKEHGKSMSPRRSEKDLSDWEKFERDRNNTLAAFDSRYRRFGGGTSGLGGYSPRRRRSEAAIKTPSPPPRSPERRKPRAWDLPPSGMDRSMVAAISAAHQAAAQQAAIQHAAAALASVTPLVSGSVLLSPGATSASASSGLTPAPTMIPSLLQQVNPAVTAVTLTQATRPLRRLYVGNVPATVSDGELLEFMNAAMLSANANHLAGTKPCINCSVNVDKSYAFAEFITPEDATAALAFDGVTLHGTTLKIRRPKDFAQPANGGAENASPILDMVSSSVADSPHKVFVGGISSSLSSEKVKEIVTAFGQLKAYHWEVDRTKQPPQAYAFLEYMDPSATLKACAGLNGMKLGTRFLTVVQATPDCSVEVINTERPSYAVPEHAKPLLQAPSRILELQNMLTEDELRSMCKQDIDENIEDIRLECSRFGNVKSMHIIQFLTPRDGEKEKGTISSSKEACEEPCYEGRLSTEAVNLEQVGVVVEQSKVAVQDSSIDVSLSENLRSCSAGDTCSHCEETAEKNRNTTPDLVSSDEMTEIGGEESRGTVGCITVSTDTSGTQVQNALTRLEDLNGEGIHVMATEASKVFGRDTPSELVGRSNGGARIRPIKEESDLSPIEGSCRHVGKVYVEFSREESACQAAHALHGRTFAGRKVIVSYFPLKLYQKKFHKGLGPRTYEEKQALALAVQGHLTAHIKD